jgi:DNA polymerase-3 subunit gamma/tau
LARKRAIALKAALESVKVRSLPDTAPRASTIAMSYTVLARKYRPQIFADLVGQEHVSRTIGNAIKQGRVAHAFLFTGARGVGKTTTARLLAKALNCEQGPSPEPCNACSPCQEITVGADLDVLEIDGASNNSVDDVRRLQESLPYRPARDRFKVVIVDEVHMLSAGAFNAFLKTLEEPPPHVKFIFATTEIHKVPITIRSRCQRHDFRLIPHAMVAARVKEILAHEKIEADEEAIGIVVREAGGSLRDALTVLDQLLAFGGDGLKGDEVAKGLGIADQKSVLAVAQAVLDADAASCLATVASLGEQGLDMLHFARQLVSLARDIVVLRVAGDDSPLVDRVEDERQQIARIAQAHSAQHLERSFAGLARLVDEVGQSANPLLALEMGLVRLADRPPLEPLSELLARLTALEERFAGKGGGPSNPAPGASSGGDGAGRGPRRPPVQAGAASGAPAPRELRTPNSTDARRPSPVPTRRSEPAQPPKSIAPEAVTSVGAVSAPHTGDVSDDGGAIVPPAWRNIISVLHATQPALGAVLEHGVPLQVDATCVRLGFPEGSFFGKQAATDVARQALAVAAERVLGQRPRVEIGFAMDSTRPTVAAEEAAQQKERHAQIVEAALNHPRVKEALDVFPEADGHLDVQVDS